MGGLSGGEVRRGVGVKRDGKSRLQEVLKTLEAGIFYLIRLRGKGKDCRDFGVSDSNDVTPRE